MPSLLPTVRAILLGGPWTPLGTTERLVESAQPTGCPTNWITPLIRKLFEIWPEGFPPDRTQLTEWLKSRSSLRRAFAKVTPEPRLSLPHALAPRMSPVRDKFRNWSLPALTSKVGLAEWLGVTTHEIDWLTRVRRDQAPENEHYRFRWVPKPGSPRLFEIPRHRLMQIQRSLTALFSAIPPHPAAHGFEPGRSVVTALEPHVGRPVLLRMDLRHFFPSIRRGRVFALLRDAGYPHAVARIIAMLVTSTLPAEILDSARPLCGPAAFELLKFSYLQPHLPQGSPASPVIANRIAWRLDQRLSGLAAQAGLSYTRYADDLLFSGDLSPSGLRRFRNWVMAIVLDEGFFIRNTKTRVMTASQQQSALGMIVNQKVQAPRLEFDQLRAILHNCARHGVAAQNRDEHPDYLAHLRGRISYIAATNPQRGAKLLQIWERIAIQQ